MHIQEYLNTLAKVSQRFPSPKSQHAILALHTLSLSNNALVSHWDRVGVCKLPWARVHPYLFFQRWQTPRVLSPIQLEDTVAHKPKHGHTPIIFLTVIARLEILVLITKGSRRIRRNIGYSLRRICKYVNAQAICFVKGGRIFITFPRCFH